MKEIIPAQNAVEFVLLLDGRAPKKLTQSAHVQSLTPTKMTSINKTHINRIMSDIRDIHTDVVRKENIYYYQFDDNMYKGHALIFGPAGTPYEDLPLLFDIDFPNDYPFTNPKVTFQTCDAAKTRFHPNLYVDGKVCLSILGTWEGPKWTAVFTLHTVLISLQSLLTTDPIIHEPGHDKDKGSEASKNYSEYVEHSALQYIIGRINETASASDTTTLLKFFQEEWRQALPGIIARTEARLIKLVAGGEKKWTNVIYGCNSSSSYGVMLKSLQQQTAHIKLDFSKLSLIPTEDSRI